MKKAILYGMLLIYNLALAQNLVPNYSFEDTIKCDQYDNQFIGYVADWTGIGGGGGLCYYNGLCSTNDMVGVPRNLWGYQHAHTGNAYAGIYTYSIDTIVTLSDSNVRNYVQAQLTMPLMAGVTYYLTFYVNLADSCKYACNNMGALFSDSALTFSRLNLESFSPQIINNSVTNPLTDKVDWTKVSGRYRAVGGEQYLIIGNFLHNYQCDTVVFANTPTRTDYLWTEAYYFIDDVILSPDSTYADSLMCAMHRAMPLAAHAGQDTSICKGGQALLGRDSAKSWAHYSWQPATGLSEPNSAQTLASPTVTTTYTLTVANDSLAACSFADSLSQDTVTVYVCNESLYMPNAFSPNGDGQNDILLAKGSNIQSFYIAIYDRWGNKVFESNNINQGWDGTYKGQPENTGTYVYYIKGTYEDGTSFEKKGNVALVR